MKGTICRWAALTATTLVVVILCLWGHAVFGWLGSDSEGFRIRWTFLVLWPGIALGQFDHSHSWTVIPIGALLATIVSTWFCRDKNWIALLRVGALLAIGYCLVGRLSYSQLVVPIPSTTPYDSDVGGREVYLEAFREGYLVGASGGIRTFCFSPKIPTRGFYDGTAKGILDYNRMLGRLEVPAHQLPLIRRLAKTDGVALTPTPSGVEPAGAAQAATRPELKAP